MGDTSKHLTYFKVENFKRFESFEMNDLGQFNLIVGDNNVGKTSLLEALLFDRDNWSLLNNLFRALQFRKIKNQLVLGDIEFFVNKELSLNEMKPTFRFLWDEKGGNHGSDFVAVSLDKKLQRIFFDSNSIESLRGDFYLNQNFDYNPNLNFPFVPFYRGHDNDLIKFYSRLQQNRSMKKSFIKGLKTISPLVEEIEQTGLDSAPHLIVYQEGMNSSIPLALFGDGMLKLFRLLAEIILNKGGRLMIDEVDAGIHFSRFKEFWKAILRTAKDNDVQLFMTTHNEECIKYFIEALNENESGSYKIDARSISLAQLPDKSVKAYTYTFDQLEANIIQGNEVRGGAR
jgi:AAA15 family ATPase/GTPase